MNKYPEIEKLKKSFLTLSGVRTVLNKLRLNHIDGLDNRVWLRKPLTPTQFYRVTTGW